MVHTFTGYTSEYIVYTLDWWYGNGMNLGLWSLCLATVPLTLMFSFYTLISLPKHKRAESLKNEITKFMEGKKSN